MNEVLFLCWTGWGVFFTAIIVSCFIGHIFVTVKLGSGTPLRNIIGGINLLAIALVFFTSGWIAGLLSIPIGMILGVPIAKILIPSKR
jgi:hypothetical protein